MAEYGVCPDESENIDKYLAVSREPRKLWNKTLVLIIIGLLEMVMNNLG